MPGVHQLALLLLGLALTFLALPWNAALCASGAAAAAPLLAAAAYSLAAWAASSPVALHGSTVTYVRGEDLWYALERAGAAGTRSGATAGKGAILLLSHTFNHMDSFVLFTEMERATRAALIRGLPRPRFTLVGRDCMNNRLTFWHVRWTRGRHADVRMVFTRGGQGTVAELTRHVQAGRHVVLMLASTSVGRTGPFRLVEATGAQVITMRIDVEPGGHEMKGYMAHFRVDYAAVPPVVAQRGMPSTFMHAVFQQLYPTRPWTQRGRGRTLADRPQL